MTATDPVLRLFVRLAGETGLIPDIVRRPSHLTTSSPVPSESSTGLTEVTMRAIQPGPGRAVEPDCGARCAYHGVRRRPAS